MIQENLILKRIIIGRLVFTYFLLALLFRLLMHATPSGMMQPVLYRYNFDFTYWVMALTGITQGIMQYPVNIIFDVVLIGSCFTCIIYPLKNIYAIIFGTLFLIYVVIYNTYIVHHSHPMALMTLFSLPFFTKNVVTWHFLWQALRYYVCYAYFISFVWKAFFGKSLFFWNMGVNSVKINLVEYIYHFPETILSGIYRYLIDFPAILNIGLVFIFLLEGTMVIGLFTKKYDRYLMLIPVAVHLSTYLFSDVYFFEMMIGVLTFFTWRDLVKAGRFMRIDDATQFAPINTPRSIH